MKIEDLFQNLKSIPRYAIEIGVFSEDGKRKDDDVTVGINNAQLMYIHENGSYLNNIPARPVLQMTIDWANENLVKKSVDNAIEKYIDSDFDVSVYEQELNKLCVRMEKYARKIIYSNDGRLEPNAPSTVKRKGDNHPLFDTGQLARSITCRLIKI